MKRTLTALSLVAFAGVALAQQATPVGLWKTIDDETKSEKSQVRIVDAAGTLSAKIEKLTDPSKQTAVCEKCSDDRKGQPITVKLKGQVEAFYR